MTDEQRGEYLRMLECDVAERAALPLDGASWAIVRHMTRGERIALRLWLWLRARMPA